MAELFEDICGIVKDYAVDIDIDIDADGDIHISITPTYWDRGEPQKEPTFITKDGIRMYAIER